MTSDQWFRCRRMFPAKQDGPTEMNAYDDDGSRREPFWRTRALADLTEAQWESLCDGCARCCLLKLEDAETGEVHYTDVACRLLDRNNCRCTDYAHRAKRVRDCVRLDAASATSLDWLPPTCAYRRLAEGKDLCWWHPLVSGTWETVHLAGVSVRGKCVPESAVCEDELHGRLVRWPLSPVDREET